MFDSRAWGRTLASVHSLRAKPDAAVSTPISWDEVGKEISIADFRMQDVLKRIIKLGNLFKPLLAKMERTRLEALL